MMLAPIQVTDIDHLWSVGCSNGFREVFDAKFPICNSHTGDRIHLCVSTIGDRHPFIAKTFGCQVRARTELQIMVDS